VQLPTRGRAYRKSGNDFVQPVDSRRIISIKEARDSGASSPANPESRCSIAPQRVAVVASCAKPAATRPTAAGSVFAAHVFFQDHRANFG